MSNYVGITIGPIYETIMSVSSPAGLWCASGIFSMITESLCKRIRNFDPDAKIISPFYDKDASAEKYVYNIQQDGIGRYHDRIFFKSDKTGCDLKKALDEAFIPGVKDEVADGIYSSLKEAAGTYTQDEIRSFCKHYIRINYVVSGEEIACKDNNSCILNLSHYLDSLELCATFANEQTKNPMLKLFDGTVEGRNAYIRNCFIAPDNKSSSFHLLNQEGKVKNVKEIANPGNMENGLKKYNYFAVVKADGDFMGDIIGNLPTDDMVTEFSEACLAYSTAAADLISKYEGVTVYAGGDDLLFLAPVENNNQNIFGLCGEITKKFDECFKDIYEKANEKHKEKKKDKELAKPSVSFGISVNYVKFPLYEALSVADFLLCDKAKNTEGKKCIAFQLRKASGQPLQYTFKNDFSDNEVARLLLKLISAGLNTDEKNNVLHSVIYSFDLFNTVVAECLKTYTGKEAPLRKDKLVNLLKNLNDNTDQAKYKNYVIEIAGLLDEVYENTRNVTDAKNTREDIAIKNTEYILRTAKFFVEKEGER